MLCTEDRIRKIQARKIKIIKNDIKKKIKKNRFAKKYTGLASLRAFYLKNFTIQNNNTKDNKKPKQKEEKHWLFMDSPLENLVGGGGRGGLMYKKIQAREKLKGKNSCMQSNL